MKKTLWLPAWYPNKTEPFSGDFIQRHARAVSLYYRVQVIHIIRDKEGQITKKIKEENFQNGNLAEKIIYYYSTGFPISFIDKIISNISYNRLYRIAIKNYIEQEGIPQFAHVHIVNKNGLLALWLKRKFNIPYFISEHWTIYLSNAIPQFYKKNFFFRIMCKKIMKAAEGCSAVSQHLAAAINRTHNNIIPVVIPNVVDTAVFFPLAKKEEGPTRFIHISGLDYQKNPSAIFEAFAIVKRTNPAFVLTVFGPSLTEIHTLIFNLGLEKNVFFYGEVPQTELADFVRSSQALILYSRYETFGCVLIEANACGVPAIVSDIPVFHEIIKEGVNGYFVPGDNPAALAGKIVWLMEHPRQIPDTGIANTANEKYSYETVGKQFCDFYKSSLRD